MEEFLDMLRTNVAVVYVVVFVPLTCLLPLSVHAAEEFKVYRLQHFDLQGVQHGSRSHAVNAEAKTYGSKSVLRKCVVMRWYDATMAKIRELTQNAVGAVLILFPSSFQELNSEEREAFKLLEQQMLQESFAIPIFACFGNDHLNYLINNLESSVRAEQGASAVQALLNAMFGNGFQLVTAASSTKPLSNFKMYNIVGRLTPDEKADDAETIAIVAHYDSFGSFPGLSYGADADATGVAAYFELMRIISRLYNKSKTRLRKKFVFVLSAGGKFNYQGIRHMLEDPVDSPDNHFRNLKFAICVDMLGNGDALRFYVSKPPRPETPMALMFDALRSAGEKLNRSVVLMHKKINLADEYFGWEHERFSMKKLPGFTLTHVENYRDPSRNSILDLRESVDVEILRTNVAVLAEALLRYSYNVTYIEELSFLTDALDVQVSHLQSWLDLLSSYPRSMQMFADGTKNQLLVSLFHAAEHYVKDVQMQHVSVDKKEPEFVLYDGAVDQMHIYRVKSAIFDLLLAIVIASYIGLIYLFVTNFFTIYSWIQRISSRNKQKQT